jgi:hypothetical protein
MAAPVDRGVCVLCGDSGYVIVLHPNTVYGKTTRRYTLAVTCRCFAGRHRADAARSYFDGNRKQIRFYTLEEYEYEFPDWRKDMGMEQGPPDVIPFDDSDSLPPW